MSKKILALILTVAMVCSLCVVPAMAAETQSVTFADAQGNWAESSINRWAAAGIVTGDDLGNFNPSKNLRRCELAIILARLLGLTEKASADTFTDVTADDWYADGILKCSAAGIMEGWGGMAHPLKPITREQAITMVGRSLGVKTRASQILMDRFSDGAQISSYAAPYMAPLTALGILSGVGDGTKAAPQDYIDRASTMALLDKAITSYVTAPGEVKVDDASKFIVVNATAGDVTLTGAAAGVLITKGNKANVKFSGMTADTVKLDSPVTVSVVNNSKVNNIDVNAPATVTVEGNSRVSNIDTTDAPEAKINHQLPTGSSGGGGGGGSRPTTPTTTTYTISVDTAIQNGDVRADKTKAAMGDTVTLTVTVKSGYELGELTVTGKSGATVAVTPTADGKYTFKMPGENVSVTASFKVPSAEPTYNVTVDTDIKNGTVTASADKAKAGETVTLTVAAAEGYELETLTVKDADGTAVAVTDNQFTMPAADVTVTATFKKTATTPVDPVDPGKSAYTITVDTDGTKGTVTVASKAVEGSSVTVTIAAKTGYELDTVTVDGETMTATNGKVTFTMPGHDVTVAVTFKEKTTPVDPPATEYTITVGAATNGTVTASVDKAEAGAEVALTVKANDGYELDSLTVQDASNNNVPVDNNKFTMPASNVTVSATFKEAEAPTPTPTTYTVTDNTASDAHGSLTISKTTDIAANEKVTVTVTPDEGYELATLTVDGQDVTAAVTGNTYEITVTENVTVSATFQETTPEPETVTLTLGLAGDDKAAVKSVSLKDVEGTTVEKGTTVTIVVEFKEGYDADAYTVTCDTVTFAVNSEDNTAVGTFTANETVTLTITVVAKKPEDAALVKAED